METPFLDTEKGRRAKAVYEAHIKERIQPEDQGKYLVIDLDTGEYELDTDDVAAAMRAYRKRPAAERYLVRIGHETAGSFRVMSTGFAQ